MARNSSSLVKTSIYLSREMIDQLNAHKDSNGGVATAKTIRTAIAQHIGPKVSVAAFDEAEVVRRAILNGGEITTSENEFGRNFDGVWQDPISGKYVYVSGIIVNRGWPQHAAASVDSTTFCVPELLSSDELATANNALRGDSK